jgi:hypothetical protein
VGWLAFPWFLAVLAGASIATPPSDDGLPQPVRVVLLLVALAPTAIWLSARIGRPMWNAMLLPEDRQPRIHFDTDGLVVVAKTTQTAFMWKDIGGLDAAPRWFSSRMLRDRDGSPLLPIPESLAAGRASSLEATAAQCAVAMRPDLFQLEYNNALGLPLGFSRRRG